MKFKYAFSFFLLRLMVWLLGILVPLVVALRYIDNVRFVGCMFGVMVLSYGVLYATRNHHFNMRYIDTMDGETFENYCLAYFRHHGYRHVRITKKSHDFGADLTMKKGLHNYVVQAKRYNHNIGMSAIQQALAAKAYYKADRAIVITNQHFTPAAKKLAEVNAVILLDRDTLFPYHKGF